MKKILILTTAIIISTNSNAFWGEKPKDNLLKTYANIALANYSDALRDAKIMSHKIKDFTNNPTKQTIDEAKASWLNARESYGQTEAFRLQNGPIDAEEGFAASFGAPEGRLNAWPLDENMIDYTINAQGKRTSGNIIDSSGLFTPEGGDAKAINITTIDATTIANLNENGGDANVATGYHAIEFLLWGQDQDYSNFIKDTITNGALIAGNRPLNDYTTDKNSNRRKQYLNAAASLIVSDLESIVNAWKKDDSSNYRAALLGYNADKAKNINQKIALMQIFSGLGVFIKSELANERIAVAVLTPSEEDEHSCFSDNTHRDIATNYQGFKNIVFGTYNGIDYGKAPIDALENKNKIMNLINSIELKINQINHIAQTSRHFDYQIRANDPQSQQITKLKNELRKLGDQMVYIAKANGVNIGIEDVTDNEETKL